MNCLMQPVTEYSMSSKNKSTVFLIPSALDDQYSPNQLAAGGVAQIAHLNHFAVENLRHARRYLRKLLPDLVIDNCTFYEMGKHADDQQLLKALAALNSGNDLGVISEAGLPGVADPGNKIVARAHQYKHRVKPLIGPGSVFLALMASGFNGQEFTFHGYLPREGKDRTKTVRHLEQTLHRTGYTQIFMETPFRNNQLLEDLLQVCNPETGLCIASSLTTDEEKIVTRPVSEWKKAQTNLHKKPAMFLLGRL